MMAPPVSLLVGERRSPEGLFPSIKIGESRATKASDGGSRSSRSSSSTAMSPPVVALSKFLPEARRLRCGGQGGYLMPLGLGLRD
jgi:hypothetical protein